MLDAMIVRARTGCGQEDEGLAAFVIDACTFAVYPPKRGVQVSGVLAVILASSLALLRRRGRFSLAVSCTQLVSLFRRHFLARFTLQNSVLLTPQRPHHFDMIGRVYQHIPIQFQPSSHQIVWEVVI
jgi:hypothetical protein